MVFVSKLGPVLVQKLSAVGNVGFVQDAKASKHAIGRCLLSLNMMSALVPDHVVVYLPIGDTGLEPFPVHPPVEFAFFGASLYAAVLYFGLANGLDRGFSIVVELTLPMRLARVRFPEAATFFFG